MPTPVLLLDEGGAWRRFTDWVGERLRQFSLDLRPDDLRAFVGRQGWEARRTVRAEADGSPSVALEISGADTVHFGTSVDPADAERAFRAAVVDALPVRS